MNTRDVLLLDMLKKKLLKERFHFKNQNVVKRRSKFYVIMWELERNGYINRVKAGHNFRYYTLTDKGYVTACIKTSDDDCPIYYQNMIKGFVHYTIEP